MGKKRELREEIERLSAQITRKAQREVDARRKADEGMAAALKNMVNEPFLIVTKSGAVLTGRASNVTADQPTATFGMGSWAERVPVGPKKYSASITIEPLRTEG
jgi:hypothetical protein